MTADSKKPAKAGEPALAGNLSEQRSKFAALEQEVLKFWSENKIFEKSLAKKSPKGGFVFYDGPPFANGLPHYGHLLASVIKDVVPRYKTMQGFHVARRWGWDCHGLPVENLVEKELGLKAKTDIERYGVEKFNAAARESVMRFTKEWREFIERVGRWVDMDNDYRTMDSGYTETVWWIFKTLHDKGLLYEGFKSMYLCPRCGTTLSNFEVSQGYKDVKDITVYPKFELVSEPGVYLAAWTTTAWTLPGNVALAVNKNLDYARVLYQGAKYIVAANLVEKVFGGSGAPAAVSGKIKGSELVGQKYHPLFDYYSKDGSLKNRPNGWKVYAADFVSIEEGTGIVHIAPAFGEDDMRLGQEKKLPFVQHVDVSGRFKDEVKDFAGLKVKPKEDPQATDVLILKNLAERDLILKKETITHSYPFCWRCDTPLLNYAASSWFVKVTDFKEKLVSINKRIEWVPDDIREGRFGNWLSGARDWAISRSRYWGAPIPVWRCENCKRFKVVGSVEELETGQSGNTFILMRHGQSENNVAGTLNSDSTEAFHLTSEGRAEAKETARKLVAQRIDLIFSSPFPRTKETAEIAADVLGISRDRIIYDNRISELKFGIYEGATVEQYIKRLSVRREKFVTAPEGGESHFDMKNRVGAFLEEVDGKYKNKRILVVSHEGPIWMAVATAKGLDVRGCLAIKKQGSDFVDNAEVREVVFNKIPRNHNYELDLHRPFIDEVRFPCVCKGQMKRVPEVFDCWFESGSMPYGSNHYPFENTDKFDPRGKLFKNPKGFPADFIAEGLDQTRGWFYSMLVLAVALFEETSYKNVLVNGILLAEDGQKMSKRLQNYPDPMEVVEKYGADALRYYLLSNPVVRAQEMNFSEKGIDEITKKVLARLDNVLAFYKLYESKEIAGSGSQPKVSSNILDRWIISRLNRTTKTITQALERYELDKASRPIADFVDDLSTWYLRRSRERFKGDNLTDKKEALEVTRFILLELSKLAAPFMPFYAEYLYEETGGERESVHLEEWPLGGRIDEKLLSEMSEVREVISEALEQRAKANCKVRQPLASLVTSSKLSASAPFDVLVKEEVNVLEVVLGKETILDTRISPELKEKGELRDFIRLVQELRKNSGLTINNVAVLEVETDDEGINLVSKYEKEIKRITLLSEIRFGQVSGEVTKIGDRSFKLEISKG